MTIENNNLDNLHDIYSRAQERMSFKDEKEPFSDSEVLECIAHELVGIRQVLENLIQ
jgi:uncharacterized protein YfkK (UPF0435 family)